MIADTHQAEIEALDRDDREQAPTIYRKLLASARDRLAAAQRPGATVPNVFAEWTGEPAERPVDDNVLAHLAGVVAHYERKVKEG